jgi:hypothetical protein
MEELLRLLVIIVILIIIITVYNIIIIRKRNPNRPIIACYLDILISSARFINMGTWGKDNDILAALKNAIKEFNFKITDLGGKDNGERMIQKYNITRKLGLERSEAKYTPLGSYISLISLTERMKTRLGLVDYFKKHQSVEKINVGKPVFITGFPRTGTTFLHELLGLHPNVRMHYTWEQMDPIPRTKDESKEAQLKDRKVRYNASKNRLSLLLGLVGDEIQSIHRIGYDDSEECTIPCSIELPLNLFELPLMVYAADEIINIGAGETYDFYKKYLQLLTWQQGTNDDEFTWMLKCPFHLPYLKELADAFPGSTVVWTHRNPTECIASACSLYETILGMVMEKNSINKIALGKAVMNYSELAMKKAIEAIPLVSSKIRIEHVKYTDSVKIPKETCKRIAEAANLGFSNAYDSKITAYLQKNAAEREKLKARNKSEKELHSYSLEEYGLSKQIVDEKFAFYKSYY